MWIMLNDAFFSIVDKDCAADELLVRARRKGDIERWFPFVPVTETPRGDYLYRAKIKRTTVAAVVALAVRTINYDNFKDSVGDQKLHIAYTQVWTVMAAVQPLPPYGRTSSMMVIDDQFDQDDESPKDEVKAIPSRRKNHER